ncbi:hypothetical protein SKAU_G00038470 [Synaphobranchus kaupii]|uniref:Uncharacterized protein n=1 Tax=Synaphobranchus kaupii TaxID=118154 RepID=A0A9Q1JHL9_SYNKA|nr:hypothetical protein SKAU_G00038470 [Synaphobranchus kaupii]
MGHRQKGTLFSDTERTLTASPHRGPELDPPLESRDPITTDGVAGGQRQTDYSLSNLIHYTTVTEHLCLSHGSVGRNGVARSYRDVLPPPSEAGRIQHGPFHRWGRGDRETSNDSGQEWALLRWNVPTVQSKASTGP